MILIIFLKIYSIFFTVFSRLKKHYNKEFIICSSLYILQPLGYQNAIFLKDIHCKDIYLE